MKTNIECGACREQLSVEHYTICRRVQCKCQHYRKHHKFNSECRKKLCRCRIFDPILKFDEFWGWSKAVKPEIIYNRHGQKVGIRL